MDTFKALIFATMGAKEKLIGTMYSVREDRNHHVIERFDVLFFAGSYDHIVRQKWKAKSFNAAAKKAEELGKNGGLFFLLRENAEGPEWVLVDATKRLTPITFNGTPFVYPISPTAPTLR